MSRIQTLSRRGNNATFGIRETTKSEDIMAKKTNYKKLAKNAVAAVNILDAITTTPDEDSRVSLPPTIKIDDIQGRTVGGRIESFNPFRKGKMKGTIIVMKHDSGQKFGLPMTAAIKYALARHLGKDGEDFDGNGAVGLHLSVKGMGKGVTKSTGKAVNLFDIFISK